MLGDRNRMIMNEDNEDLKEIANTREGHEGWDSWHNEFEKASRVPLFESSTLSSLCVTFLIINCFCTHGTPMLS